ncbi:hypothetical protein KKH18_04010, partial [bacterium]|nr:hypothetical protein [bacterium]
MRYGVLVILIGWIVGWTQPPDTVWSRTYLLCEESDYFTYDIGTLSNGDIISCGSTGSVYTEGFIMRLSADGDLVWHRYTRNWEGIVMTDIVIDENDDILFTGNQYDGIPLVGKISSNNDSLWSQTYEFGNMPWIYFTWGICETPAGNFIIAADKAVGDEILVFEIDPDGELLWSNIWTEDNLVSARDIIPVPSGGYVIAGAQYGGVTVPYYLRLMRLDEAGDSLWTRIYEPWAECDGHCVLTTEDG